MAMIPIRTGMAPKRYRLNKGSGRSKKGSSQERLEKNRNILTSNCWSGVFLDLFFFQISINLHSIKTKEKYLKIN
jgi:hypothetical protein